MFYSIFVQGILITVLFSLSFMIGGYISFKILNNQRQKEKVLFKEDILIIDNLRDKLKQTIIRLVKVEKSNVNTLFLYDKLFAEILIEVAKEVSYEDKELASIHLEEYATRRRAFEEKT